MDNQLQNLPYKIVETLAITRNYALLKAIKQPTGELVVIKSLAPEREKDEQLRNNFLLYARTMQLLQHTNIRHVYELFEEGQSVYLAEEYIDGKTLTELFQNPTFNLSVNTALDYGLQIMDAVQAAYAKHIIHGQLNPDCIYIKTDNTVIVDGFGKPFSRTVCMEGNNFTIHPVYYLAPEQLNSETKNAACDIYSIGVIIYQMLTNRLPWHLSDLTNPLVSKEKTISQMILDPAIFNPQVPFWLFTILRKALQVPIIKRFQSIEEFRNALLEEKEISTFSPHIYPAQEEAKVSSEFALPELENKVEEETPKLYTEPEEKAISEEPVKEEITPPPESEKPQIPETSDEVDFTSFLEESDYSESDENLKLTQTWEENLFPEEVEIPIEELKPAIQPAGEIITPSQPEPMPPPEPEKPASIPQIETPLPPKKEPPIRPAVAEKPALRPSPKTAEIEEEREEEIKPLSKTFKIIAIVCLIVILIVAGKYFFQSRKVAFHQQSQDSTDIMPEAEDEVPKVKNEPIEMISINGGEFVLGSMEAEAEPDEFPIFSITIPNFYISKYEITQKEWMMVNGTNPSHSVDNRRPVDNVSFFDAVEFCNAKSELDGLIPCYNFKDSLIICDFRANGYRLPTEAEWEYAAKAGIKDNSVLYSGGNDPDLVAWFADNSSGYSHPVGLKIPNSLGLYDMSGNVMEWCWNYYQPYANSSAQQFSGPAHGDQRVLRGGSFQSSAVDIRCTKRFHLPPWSKGSDIGFRVVRSL